MSGAREAGSSGRARPRRAGGGWARAAAARTAGRGGGGEGVAPPAAALQHALPAAAAARGSQGVQGAHGLQRELAAEGEVAVGGPRPAVEAVHPLQQGVGWEAGGSKRLKQACKSGVKQAGQRRLGADVPQQALALREKERCRVSQSPGVGDCSSQQRHLQSGAQGGGLRRSGLSGRRRRAAGAHGGRRAHHFCRERMRARPDPSSDLELGGAGSAKAKEETEPPPPPHQAPRPSIRGSRSLASIDHCRPTDPAAARGAARCAVGRPLHHPRHRKLPLHALTCGLVSLEAQGAYGPVAVGWAQPQLGLAADALAGLPRPLLPAARGRLTLVVAGRRGRAFEPQVGGALGQLQGERRREPHTASRWWTWSGGSCRGRSTQGSRRAAAWPSG